MNPEALTLKKIIKGCRELNIYEKRLITDKKGELVFYSKDIMEWNKLLIDMLGPAAKPEGVRPTKDNKMLTKEHGGIRSNQTLFKKDYSDRIIIAMLWPWQRAEYTTLKIIFMDKESLTEK